MRKIVAIGIMCAALIMCEKKYTVAFNAEGGTACASQEVNAGVAAVLPATTQNDYIFNGWYTSDGTKAGDAGAYYTPSSSVTLYARWTDNSSAVSPTVYTVAFNAEGGTACASKEVNAGATAILPATTRSGYTFNGWYTSGGTRAGDAGASYAPSSSVTLYARWQESTPTVPISFVIRDQTTGPIPYGRILVGTVTEAGASGVINGESEMNKLIRNARESIGELSRPIIGGNLIKGGIGLNDTLFFLLVEPPDNRSGYVQFVTVPAVRPSSPIPVEFNLRNKEVTVEFSIDYNGDKDTFQNNADVDVTFFYRPNDNEGNNDTGNFKTYSTKVRLQGNNKGFIKLNSRELEISPWTRIEYRIKVTGKKISGLPFVSGEKLQVFNEIKSVELYLGES
jgi:uncharacterized repeat protein (TIGR02543 family)